MRTTTANWDTEAVDNEKNPVILVDFNGITRRYSSGTFGDISANEKKYLRQLRMNLGNIEPLDHLSEIEETEIEILDKGLDVADKLKDNDFEGRDLTVKAGFDNLNEADFMSFPAQKVRNVTHGTDLLSWFFTARDTKFNLKDEVFRTMPQTTLNGDHASGAATLTVVSSSDFIDPAELPTAVRAGVVINNEVVRYTTKPLGTTMGGLTKGTMGTTDSGHNDGDLVTQCLIFELVDPLTAMLFVLMTTDDGTGHDYYDLNQHLTTPQVTGIGLGLTVTEVDVETIERLGYKYFERDVEAASRLPAWKPEQAVRWLQNEILRPSSCFVFLSSGKLSVKTFDYLEIDENYSAVDTLADGDILNGSVEMDLDNLINVIEIRYDIHPITRNARKIKRYKLDNSVTQYGQNQVPFVLNHPNVDAGTNTNYIADAICRRWFYLWGNQTGRYDISTRFENLPIEPGDDLSITHGQFVDLMTAARGWTAKKSMVLEQSLGLEADSIEHRLSGFTWEMLTRVSSFYTTVKRTALDRETVTFSATNTAALEAADGYYDETDDFQVFIFLVEITPPGVGSPSQAWHTISLGLHVQQPAGTDQVSDNRRFIRYDPSSSTAFTVPMMVTTNALTSMDRYKVDWYEASATAVSGERPTVKFDEMWLLTLDQAISEL